MHKEFPASPTTSIALPRLMHSGCRRKPAGTASLYYIGAFSSSALTALCMSYVPGKNVTIQPAVQSPANYEASSRMI